MIEITGNLWDYYRRDGHVICITTNGFTAADGSAVMGRGCAYEATQRIPGIAMTLGRHLKKHGNVPTWLNADVISFPVKRVWWEKADLGLISGSTDWRGREAFLSPHMKYVLPRPGCGNGHRSWLVEVKPIIVSLPDNVLVIHPHPFDFGHIASCLRVQNIKGQAGAQSYFGTDFGLVPGRGGASQGIFSEHNHSGAQP